MVLSDDWFSSSRSVDGGALWNPAGFQFLSVSLTSGVVLAEFSDLQVSKFSYRFEEKTSETVTIPWRNIPSNWNEATIPYGVAIVLVSGLTVLWGGIVVKRERVLQDSGLSLTLATVEHYFDSVYVKDHTYSKCDQCEIVKDLVSSTLTDHRFTLLTNVSSSRILRDRTYKESSEKTLLSVLQDFSNVQNGPEWCTSWQAVEGGRYLPVLTVADRIGSSTPITTFDDSVMTSFRIVEDYTTGYGSNMVVAVGGTSDEGQLRSDVMTVNQYYRPVVEYVARASDSITQKDTLNAHAMSALRQLQDGTNTVAMTLDLMSAPVVYKDWSPGDVVAWNITDDSGRLMGFDHGEARVVGYDIDFSGSWTVTPVLQ